MDDVLNYSSGGRAPGSGRLSVPSAPYTRMYNETDMEGQIHQLEQDAYVSVLSAFKAQADSITWEKESLITELRKELRLSDEEHREFLACANAEDTTRRIRAWRESGGIQSGMLNAGQAVHSKMPSPTVSASLKKQKTNRSKPSQSFGKLSPQPGHPHQPSSSIPNRGPVTRSKAKKHKPGLPRSSSMKSAQYHSSDATGRGQVVNRTCSGAALLSELTEGTAFDPLIGRRVRTRWPEDNTFYEAVSPPFSRQISPEDIKWVGEDPGVSLRHCYDGLGHGMNRPTGPNSVPWKGRGLAKYPTIKDSLTPKLVIKKKRLQDIQIRDTDILINEVERALAAANHPASHEIEKAKKVLEEHEQALANAVASLAGYSD